VLVHLSTRTMDWISFNLVSSKNLMFRVTGCGLFLLFLELLKHSCSSLKSFSSVSQSSLLLSIFEAAKQRARSKESTETCPGTRWLRKSGRGVFSGHQRLIRLSAPSFGVHMGNDLFLDANPRYYIEGSFFLLWRCVEVTSFYMAN
jgi:hypothetical protein